MDQGQVKMANVKAEKNKPGTARAKKPAKAAKAGDALVLTEKAAGVKLKDLIDRVARSSGAKRNVVKPIVEATLKVVGEALDAGESLTLQPLGRIKVNRSKESGGGSTLTIKLRRGKTGAGGVKAGDEALAEAGE